MFGHEPPEGLRPVQKGMAAYGVYMALILALGAVGGVAIVAVKSIELYGRLLGFLATVALFIVCFIVATGILNFISRRVQRALEEIDAQKR